MRNSNRYADLPRDVKLYPALCSTAAKSAFRLVSAKSCPADLSYFCVRALGHMLGGKKAIKLPPGLQTFVDNNLWYLKGKGVDQTASLMAFDILSSDDDEEESSRQQSKSKGKRRRHKFGASDFLLSNGLLEDSTSGSEADEIFDFLSLNARLKAANKVRKVEKEENEDAGSDSSGFLVQD